MGEPKHNLIVHYKSNRYIVKNVDSAQYQHLEMLSDVCEAALNEVPGNLNLFIRMHCAVPASNASLAVQDDGDVKKMFNLHQRMKDIHVFLTASQNVPFPVQEELGFGELLPDAPSYDEKPGQLDGDQLTQFDGAQDGEVDSKDKQPVDVGIDSSDEDRVLSGGYRLALRSNARQHLEHGGRSSRRRRRGFDRLWGRDGMAHWTRSIERATLGSVFVAGGNMVVGNIVDQEVVANQIRVVELRAEENVAEENRVQERRNDRGVITEEQTENKDSMGESEDDEWAMF